MIIFHENVWASRSKPSQSDSLRIMIADDEIADAQPSSTI